jgi:hypothetical protein
VTDVERCEVQAEECAVGALLLALSTARANAKPMIKWTLSYTSEDRRPGSKSASVHAVAWVLEAVRRPRRDDAGARKVWRVGKVDERR